MTGLGLVRTPSQVGVGLAVGHGGGGEATDGWQDKSAAFRYGASCWSDNAILPSLCTPLPALPIDTPTVSMR
jgi:hypothetical protein